MSTSTAPQSGRHRYTLMPRRGVGARIDPGYIERASATPGVVVTRRLPWGMIIEADSDFERIVRAKFPDLRIEQEKLLAVS